jgi:DNA-binding CsgD family transcriptional regulator
MRLPGEKRIVGRETELTLLDRFVRGDGDAVLALVEGEAGVGKTALWSAVLGGLDGVRSLVARPSAAETAAAYAALDDLLGTYRSAVEGAADPRRRALAVALLLQPGAPPEPHAVALGVLSLLDELTAEGPLVIAVDDWQWLDPSSAAVLRFALPRLPAQRARVFATLRTGAADAAASELLRSLPDGAVLELPLDPLGPSELLALVHDRTGRWLSAPALAQLHHASGGNALAALELTRAGTGAARHASDVRRLLAARVSSLPPPARAVLRGAAALAAPTVSAVAQAVPDAVDGLEPALAAGVLVRDGEALRFAHPLYAAVVEESTPPAEWRAVHRRAAGAVADSEQRARHLAAAASRPDAAVADTLADAAAHAAARGAPSAAADLAERAAELTPPAAAQLRVARLLTAVDAHMRAAEGARAGALLAALIDTLPPGPERADALLRQAVVLDERDTRPLARQALVEAGDDATVQGWAHVTLALLCWQCADADGAHRHALAAAAVAERTAVPAVRARAAVELAFQRFVRGEGVQHEALAAADRLEREAGDRMLELSARACFGFQVYLSGDLARGRALLEDELDRVAATSIEREAFVRTLLIDLEVHAGRWGVADALAARSYEISMGSQLTNWACASHWERALVDAHLGRTDAARDHAQRAAALSESAADVVWHVHARRVLGFLALSLGDAEEATRQLAPLPAMAARLRMREPMFFAFEPELIEALTLAGDLAGAREAQARLDATGRELGRPWAIATARRGRGLIAAAEGRYADAIADEETALDVCERLGQPFQLARTRLALGTAQCRAKRRGAARASLEAARAGFAQLGAALWVARADTELARIGGRRPADRDALTPTERRVAELAASGRSNREIAAALVVSERTVEANLTRCYRKLGVRSRTQLAHIANDVDSPLSAVQGPS